VRGNFARILSQPPPGATEIVQAKRKSWLGIAPSQLVDVHTNLCALVAVVIMLVMLVNSMAAVIVRPPSVVVGSVIRIATVVAVIASRIVSVVSRISVIAVSGVTKSDSDSSDPD
jgi:hypothetical protein